MFNLKPQTLLSSLDSWISAGKSAPFLHLSICHPPSFWNPPFPHFSLLGNYQVLLHPIKNILFISHIKKRRRKQSKSRNWIWNWPKVNRITKNLFGNVCVEFLQRETFYAHLSHFQQFRLKNSSKQFMAGRKNQIKIHAQQRDSKAATFSIPLATPQIGREREEEKERERERVIHRATLALCTLPLFTFYSLQLCEITINLEITSTRRWPRWLESRLVSGLELSLNRIVHFQRP